MKNYISYILTICLIIGINASCLSQGYESLLDNSSKNASDQNDITSKLIPLAEMLEKAEQNAPILKMYSAQTERNRHKLKTAKRDWMRYVGAEVSARYGMMDNFVLSDTESTNNDYSSIQSYDSEETRYFFGLFARVPLSALVDNSDVEFARSEIEMVKQQRLARLKELRQDVIIYYNNVIKYHGMLMLRSKMSESYKVQVMRAKKDFVNGNIDIAEYARLNEMLTKANLELEAIRIEFNTALLLLQELVGSPITKKNNSLE